jgi:prevent-host-death family protein
VPTASASAWDPKLAIWLLVHSRERIARHLAILTTIGRRLPLRLPWLNEPGWSSRTTTMARKRQVRTQVNIAEAKARFSELVKKAMAGQDVIITRDNKPVLRLVRLDGGGVPRTPGSAKGQVRMAEDFDATPEGFEDYG